MEGEDVAVFCCCVQSLRRVAPTLDQVRLKSKRLIGLFDHTYSRHVARRVTSEIFLLDERRLSHTIHTSLDQHRDEHEAKRRSELRAHFAEGCGSCLTLNSRQPALCAPFMRASLRLASSDALSGVLRAARGNNACDFEAR